MKWSRCIRLRSRRIISIFQAGRKWKRTSKRAGLWWAKNAQKWGGGEQNWEEGVGNGEAALPHSFPCSLLFRTCSHFCSLSVLWKWTPATQPTVIQTYWADLSPTDHFYGSMVVPQCFLVALKVLECDCAMEVALEQLWISMAGMLK